MRVIARKLALFTALSTMFALFAVGGTASASHVGRTLDVTPETDSTEAGSALHTLTATVSPAASATEGIVIRFEIESGPSDTDGNTPTSPDLTCNIAPSGTFCTVTFVSLTIGTDVVRSWIDHDGLASTTEEMDATEGRRATAAEGGTATITPGAVAEPDSTDVVSKTWTAGEARFIVLLPETDTNPSGTIHRVVATVTDADDQAVEGAIVTFTEDGTGRFASNIDDEFPAVAGQQVSTDADGEAETFTTTFPGEEGDQDITGELQPDDVLLGAGTGTDCELAVNDPVGAAAGDCSDTVTKTWGPGVPGVACTITGTEGDDVLEGTTGDDVICGLAGNDTITGLEGNDTLRGGAGNDTAKGGAGDDTVRGGAGNDALRGGPGNDTVKGGGGNDNLKGGSGNDALRGGKGTDTCRGGPGNDSIRGCEN
jgi:Ca2+-binding RTX toxin-like protein